MSAKSMNLFPASFSAIWTEFRANKKPKHTVLYDRFLFVLAITLLFIGFIIVASASMPEGQRLTENPFHFVQRHVVYLLGCTLIMIFGLQIPIEKWQQYNAHILIISILALVAVLVVGKTVNGSTRWLSAGPINIQVSEIAKLTFFCYLSSYIVRRHTEVTERSKGFVKPLIVFGILAVLILLQPDLGTIVVMFITTVGLLFLAGAKIRDFIGLLITGSLAAVALVIYEPYRMARVTSFLDPWQDPFGDGYQLTQSLMAFGRGDWFGQGLGNSIQKLEYLPEAHTDFIFAIWAEELGLFGVIALLLLQLTLALRALHIGAQALKTEHFFSGYLALAIGIWLSFQAAVNTGAASGVLPTKGLTLPLVSYGGSSLWVMTLAVVILLRVDHERRLACVQATQRGVS
ncbi:cell division protein FtsW [Psychrobium sp. 1_MG-2023]|uniref:cell division protein FtsW n=1 Tax=Psychrobium sp. 1_MG-2023 TaxID=3062624 RepID=UPI000C336D36|nr:cell division protein FtsW [Psychrobium sp. 1_MG-2023]MDP2561461.1 cell division protein FtsW [Psychrobium sp. 1_MG-2023]PKF57728.1 cell division protein FtsW [Alteromonadales bacterium alter-6D02]